MHILALVSTLILRLKQGYLLIIFLPFIILLLGRPFFQPRHGRLLVFSAGFALLLLAKAILEWILNKCVSNMWEYGVLNGMTAARVGCGFYSFIFRRVVVEVLHWFVERELLFWVED